MSLHIRRNINVFNRMKVRERERDMRTTMDFFLFFAAVVVIFLCFSFHSRIILLLLLLLLFVLQFFSCWFSYFIVPLASGGFESTEERSEVSNSPLRINCKELSQKADNTHTHDIHTLYAKEFHITQFSHTHTHTQDSVCNQLMVWWNVTIFFLPISSSIT